MPKINPNLLPSVERKTRCVTAEVPGQGEFRMWLRQPDFAELLLIQEQAQSKIAEWSKRGDWYPATPPVATSGNLWNLVVPALMLQCAENGDELAGDDRYYEQELVPIVGRVPAVWLALGEVVGELLTEAQGDLGNEPEAAGGPSSSPASKADSSTRT